MHPGFLNCHVRVHTFGQFNLWGPSAPLSLMLSRNCGSCPPFETLIIRGKLDWIDSNSNTLSSLGLGYGSEDGPPPPPFASTALMSSQSRDQIDEQFLLRGRVPLPEEKYPRSFEKRVQSGGFYVAMGLVLAVWMITPLSWYVSSLPLTRLIRNFLKCLSRLLCLTWPNYERTGELDGNGLCGVRPY